MRCRNASPLSVPTARATRKQRRNLKKTWPIRGMRTTPSSDSRLMTVMETNPPTQAVHTHTHTDKAAVSDKDDSEGDLAVHAASPIAMLLLPSPEVRL